MITHRPVSISSRAFAFCRYTVAGLVVIAFVWQIPALVWIAFFIMLASALFGITHAPLILLFSGIEKSLGVKMRPEMVDFNAMRFAHALGSLLSGACVWLLATGSSFAWSLVLIFAILKVISATGFCPASKLYACSTGGTCCRFLKKR